MKHPTVIGLILLGACALVLLGILIPHDDGANKSPEGEARLARADHAATPPCLTKTAENKIILGDVRVVPFQELYGLLSKLTPEEIAKLAEQLQTLARTAESDAKIGAFYKTWAALDAQAALASAIALRDAHFRSKAISAVLRGADAIAAAAIAHSINELPAGALSTSDKAGFLSSAVTKWSSLEPLAAAQFLDAIGAKGLDFEAAFSSTATNWATQDPAAALAWAQKHPDGYGNLAMQGAINGWWQKDPKAAEAYVSSHTSGRQEMAHSFAAMLFESDPAHSRQWVSQLPNVEARRAADSRIAQEWAQDDPQAAAQWAASLPADERGASVGLAARIWAKEDPKAAGNFLNSLGGTIRDEAVASFSASIVYEDSALALTWATTISDPSARQKSEDGIVGEWLKQDPAAARTWIQNSSLPETEKSRLLSATPGP